jgi:hypothetical protein
MKTNTTTQTLTELEAAKLAYDAAKKRLEDAKAAEFDKVKDAFAGDLKALHETYSKIRHEVKVWGDKKIIKILEKLNLQPIPATESNSGDVAAETTKSPKPTETDIFNAIKIIDKPTTGLVIEHFKGRLSSVKIREHIDNLIKEKLIKKLEPQGGEGNKKYLKVVQP